MCKKLSYENVKQIVEANGKILLTTKIEYINTQQPLKVKCTCNNIVEQYFFNIKHRKNGGCINCIKVKYEIVRDTLKKLNKKLITTQEEYIDTQHPIKVECSCSNIYIGFYKSIKTSFYCKKCIKTSYETVKQTIEDTGRILLTNKEEYLNTNTTLKIKCLCENIVEKTFKDFKINNNCKICIKLKYEYVRDIINKTGNFLLTKKEDYINTSSPLEILCRCGNIKYNKFSKFITNKGYCKECANKSRIVPYKIVRDTINATGNELLTLEIDYVNANTPVKIKCTCGEIIHNTFSQFKIKKGYCINCVNQAKLIPFNEIEQFVISRGYTLITTENEYKNVKEKFQIECNKCKYHFFSTFSNFKYNETSCKLCYINSLIIPYKEIKDLVESFGYELLTPESEYKSTKKPIILNCPICKINMKTTASAIRSNGPSCAVCNHNAKITFQDLEKYVNKSGDKLLTQKDEFKGMKTKILVKCSKCKNNYSTTFSSFKYDDVRCKCLNESKGERKIRLYLTKHKIQFIRNHYFNDCKNKNVLPFDFYLPDYNIIFEFDGIQHFIINDYFGQESFERTRENDIIKTRYCYNNGIHLFRIDYTQLKIVDEWLNYFLNELTSDQEDYNIVMTTDNVIDKTDKYYYLNEFLYIYDKKD